jgi:hypothetical protein
MGQGWPHSIRHDKLEGQQVFVLNFNGAFSREELRTIFSGLKIHEELGMQVSC